MRSVKNLALLRIAAMLMLWALAVIAPTKRITAARIVLKAFIVVWFLIVNTMFPLFTPQSYDKKKPLANGFFLFARGFSLLCEGQFELNCPQQIECHSLIRRNSIFLNTL